MDYFVCTYLFFLFNADNPFRYMLRLNKGPVDNVIGYYKAHISRRVDLWARGTPTH